MVGFDDGLEGGWWHHASTPPETPIWVQMPETADLEECRRAVLSALEAARAEVAEALARYQNPRQAKAARTRGGSPRLLRILDLQLRALDLDEAVTREATTR